MAATLGLQHTYAEQLPSTWESCAPASVPDPELVFLHDGLLRDLDLEPAAIRPDAAELFSGNDLPDDARPVAMAYAGHQFGRFVPQLGDGRALLLGERLDRHGVRRDLHCKGIGRTPFSRSGDGKATLGPMLREVVIGEALHHLGIPATRGLAVVRTGEHIRRQFGPEPGAVLTRVARSHLRVGTLQYFAARGREETVRQIVDYALARHHPERAGADDPAHALLEATALAQADLIARWMSVGFIHGVMNTDNCSLAGESIDFGPCAFLEAYDPSTVYSSIDHHGRYAYGNQPPIGAWNLARMGEALLPLLAEDPEEAADRVHAVIGRYQQAYDTAWLRLMRAKLGLSGEGDADEALITDLLSWMQDEGRDFTLTFRELADALRQDEPIAPRPWHDRWRRRLGDRPPHRVAEAMNAANPLYIARNHQVEKALDAGVQGDLGPFETLLDVLARPFTPQEGRDAHAEPAPAGFGPYQTYCGT